jgi:antitoxin CptB
MEASATCRKIGPAPVVYCGKRVVGETDGEILDIGARRRRLRFRAWHRGMREVDLLLGRFADAVIEDLDETELAGFEALLDVPDPDVLAWITGELAVPPDDDTPLLRRLLSFHGTVTKQADR